RPTRRSSDLGGRNIAHEAGDGYFVLGLEAIILADPEIILLGSATHGGTDIESVRRRPGWSALRAVAEGRVYALDDDLVSRPGPRIAEGVETLASRILPRGGEDARRITAACSCAPEGRDTFQRSAASCSSARRSSTPSFSVGRS